VEVIVLFPVDVGETRLANSADLVSSIAFSSVSGKIVRVSSWVIWSWKRFLMKPMGALP
jgi:hypothetical protein